MNAFCLFLDVSSIGIYNFRGIPHHKILFRQVVQFVFCRQVRIRITLCVRSWNFLNGNGKAKRQGKFSCAHCTCESNSDVFSFFRNIAIRNDVEVIGYTFQNRQLSLSPRRTERCNSISSTNNLQTHHIWCTFYQVHNSIF